MKPVWGLFWSKEQTLLKIVPVGVEAGISLTHYLMDPLIK
jgi:hypothetical protein